MRLGYGEDVPHSSTWINANIPIALRKIWTEMCVYVCVWMHIYILTHTYTHVDIISSVKFFIKNKSFKAVNAYKFSLFRCTALDSQVP